MSREDRIFALIERNMDLESEVFDLETELDDANKLIEKQAIGLKAADIYVECLIKRTED